MFIICQKYVKMLSKKQKFTKQETRYNALWYYGRKKEGLI